MRKSSIDIAFGAVRTAMLAVTFLAAFTIMSNVEGRRSISEEEDLEFERQLRIINKPAIKTIKNEYGDVYNFVDIYKQPAFDHPLLKDHKIQIPEGYWSSTKTKASKPSVFGMKEGCPLGTVPIRRVTKEDLIRAKSVSKKYVEFYGRKDLQSSYEVNPSLYGDSKTRLFTYWTRDNHQTTGCFNIRCTSFVQINKNVPLDSVFITISKVDKEQFNMRLGVYQDEKIKVWYLILGEKGELIGY
ncbi:uncharacterized protein LOC122650774 [Telopea speciosissima]|uniref:uncharacterized protein LOC122650774 n=1 Tax=Telopea speciosissima TaxID=54955 RepID=UPI001CC63991|nr:uncharacterized protein LOC122650774 [Telopea speciosissima]